MSNQVTNVASNWKVLNPSERRQALGVLIVLLIGTGLEVLGVGLLVPAVSLIANSEATSAPDFLSRLTDQLGHAWLTVLAISVLCLVQIGKSGFLAWSVWFQRSFTKKIEVRLSSTLLRSHLSKSYSHHMQTNSASSIRDVTAAGQFVSMSIDSMLVLASDGLVLIGLLVVLVIVEPWGTLAVLLMMGTSTFIFHGLTRGPIKRWGGQRMELEAQKLQTLQEGFAAITEIKVYGCEKLFEQRYLRQIEQSTQISRLYSTISTLPRIWLELLAFLCVGALVAVLGLSGKSLVDSLPSIAVFSAAAFRIMPTINRLIFAVQNLGFGSALANVIATETSSEPVRAYQTIPPEPSSGCILELVNISFLYPGTTSLVLEDVSLQIRVGELIGITGESGSGKSTLAGIILGLLEPIEGRALRASNVSYDSASQVAYGLGYVPQTVYLLDDTVKNNIAFGLPEHAINDYEVGRAIDAAHLSKFIQGLNHGVDTIVGESGAKVSGGQRQRIGLARAIYRRPSLLVLDEFTSALDKTSESEVLAQVMAMREKCAIVVVSHSEDVLRNCDRVFELRNKNLRNRQLSQAPRIN